MITLISHPAITPTSVGDVLGRAPGRCSHAPNARPMSSRRAQNMPHATQALPVIDVNTSAGGAAS